MRVAFAPMFLLFGSLPLLAQNGVVAGKVIDSEKGEPLRKASLELDPTRPGPLGRLPLARMRGEVRLSRRAAWTVLAQRGEARICQRWSREADARPPRRPARRGRGTGDR